MPQLKTLEPFDMGFEKFNGRTVPTAYVHVKQDKFM